MITQDLCTAIFRHITSTDLLQIILQFRRELYIQEILDECDVLYTDYDYLHEYYIALYRYYDMMIVHYFRSVIDQSFSLQLADLITLFKDLGGQTSLGYMQNQVEYASTNEQADQLMDNIPYLQIIQGIARFRDLNRRVDTRAQITQIQILSFRQSIRERIAQLTDKQKIIQSHASARLHMLQYVVHWVESRTAKSWKCWLKYLFNQLQSPERDVYLLFVANRFNTRRFLSLHL
jgi:hypothetical protein